MVAALTTSGNRPLDGSGMPSSDTSDLAETSVRLAVESLDTESLDDTLHALTSGNTAEINALVHVEHITDGDFLLEETLSVGNLVSGGSTVNLDLHNVSLVLSELELSNLGGSESTDNSAVLGDAVEVTLDGLLGVLGLLIAVVVLGESLLLGVHPVLVHSALDLGVEVAGPDRGEGAEATGGLDVTDHTDDLHGGSLNARDGVDDVLLDHLLTLTSFLVLDNVGHTGLVSLEGGEMGLVGGVVAGE